MSNMAQAFFHLDQLLRSKKVNTITSQEANILQSCKDQAIKDLGIGTASMFVVTWLATRRLGAIHRIALSGFGGGLTGVWCCGKSIDSSVDHILSMEGTRIRNELAKIVLVQYQDNPSIMQHMSTHIVSENVYDDSSSDRPKLMWRLRDSFLDYTTSERTEMHDDELNNEKFSKKVDAAKTNLQQNQVNLRSFAISGMGDPFDCVFGLPSPRKKETDQADVPNTPAGRNGRSQKRSHRRHRKRQHELLED